MLPQLGLFLLAGILQQATLPDIPRPSQAATERAEAATRNNGPRPSPVLVFQVAPDVSETAQKKHLSGTVELSLDVDEKGLPQNVVVTHGVGYGMDEKAVEAVRQYRFKPALSADGTPVSAKTTVDVTFQIF